ncbi:hypothetical protein ACNF42_05755 [Cuniculiplasma sp. SKW3]|uniref:hypothetical protein n=1 Tax=Cuniculiplasma sp. SKW3 TaxID=3400170 RepID=UPI003FD19423
MSGKHPNLLPLFVSTLVVIMVIPLALGVDSAYHKQNSLTLHSDAFLSDFKVLPESNLTVNGTNYAIARMNYKLSFFNGDAIILEPDHGLITNTGNYYSIVNNYTLQVKVLEHYSYIKESGYIKTMNLSNIGNMNSFIRNFSSSAAPIANYSYEILGITNTIYNTRVTYCSVNLTLLQVLQQVDPDLAASIEELRSTSQTIYELIQPMVYCGNKITSILNIIEPEIQSVANGIALPNPNMNSNLMNLSVYTVNYGNDSSQIYSLITSYQIQIQSFLSLPETGINIAILTNLLASLSSIGSTIIDQVHHLLASPFGSESMSTYTVSRQLTDAVSVQNATFQNTFTSVKFEEAVPYLFEYLEFFILVAIIIFPILIISRRTKKHNEKRFDNKSKIVSNMLALGVINFGATISLLFILYLFNFIPSSNIFYDFFPLYGGAIQSSSAVLLQTTSLNLMPITWLLFMMFSFFSSMIFLSFSIASHGHLSKSLQIYKDEAVLTNAKIRSPISTFIPGFLVIMEIFLIIIFIENPLVFPNYFTILVVFILFGYFIFAILFPFGIISTGRRVRLLGNFTNNDLAKLAGSLYIAGILLIYAVILFIAFYLIYAYIHKYFPSLNIYVNITTGFMFYIGIFLLLLASILLISGSAVNGNFQDYPN